LGGRRTSARAISAFRPFSARRALPPVPPRLKALARRIPAPPQCQIDPLQHHVMNLQPLLERDLPQCLIDRLWQVQAGVDDGRRRRLLTSRASCAAISRSGSRAASRHSSPAGFPLSLSGNVAWAYRCGAIALSLQAPEGGQDANVMAAWAACRVSSRFLGPAAPGCARAAAASVSGGTEAATAQLAKTVSVHSHDIIMLHCYDTCRSLSREQLTSDQDRTDLTMGNPNRAEVASRRAGAAFPVADRSSSALAETGCL
jgi:hypothetical protein